MNAKPYELLMEQNKIARATDATDSRMEELSNALASACSSVAGQCIVRFDSIFRLQVPVYAAPRRR